MADLTRLVRMFEEAEQAGVLGRDESRHARNYYDGKQLTAEQEKALKKRRQPIVIENRIRPKVDSLLGLERQTRTDPKAFPRTLSRDADGSAATDALRYVKQVSSFDMKRSEVFENLLIEGCGGVEVGHRVTKDGIDPDVTHIAWERIFYDPHSSAHDFSDASYKGYITWMDEALALSYCKPGGKWAGKDGLITGTLAQPCSSAFANYDDRPGWAAWSDSKRKRVRINTVYYLEDGVWYRAVYTLAGELEECAPSPYLDEEDKPDCALILQSLYVDADNDRYGIVRDLIPLQDEVNKRRGRFLNLASTRSVRVGASASQSPDEIRAEVARPDGVIMAEKEDFEVIANGDLTAAQMSLLQDARQAIAGIGPNAYLQGKAGQDQSGKAILAQQQAGMTEMAKALDRLAHFTREVYRKVWCRIRQLWTAERWVRVTDDTTTVRFVGFNVTKGQLALHELKAAYDAGKMDQPSAIAAAQQIRSDPTMMQPANVVGELDVDIEIEEVPEVPTLQNEQFEQLAQLMSSGMLGTPVPPEVLEMLVRSSNLRDKDKILQALANRANQPAPAPTPAEQLQLRNLAATAAERESKAALYGARATSVAAEPFMAGHALGAGQ